MLDVSLRDLEYVAALETERNFTRAAQRVHIAQPAFSQAILRIERRLGVTLFDRTSRTVSPTSAGALLAARAQQILIEVTDALAATRRAGGAPPPVLHVHVSEPSLKIPREVLALLRTAFPDQAIRQTTQPHSQVREGLVNGSLTLSVGEVVRAPGIQTKLLAREFVGAILAAEHPLALKSVINLSDLATYPIVSIDDTLSRWNTLVERAFESAGVALTWSRTTTFGAATGADTVDDNRTVLVCVESMATVQPSHRLWRPITPTLSTDWYINGRDDTTTDRIIETVTTELAGHEQ
ncbi:LysR family transcriptional regulator [Rhodococcus sp. NPDC056743]|uniref:LysR family transcriptional regulator n=1 Tax=Rhodococcus sp. NPDC056743 TaxID=3345934 RepID=UPI00366B5117